MNIIHLDHESLTEMNPLATPPTNPYIALDFQSRDHEWSILHFPSIQPIDPNLYKTPTLEQLYAIIDKYNLSQINYLKQQLQLHFDNTVRPTTIPTNSFPYVLLLIGNILDFFNTYAIFGPLRHRFGIIMGSFWCRFDPV